MMDDLKINFKFQHQLEVDLQSRALLNSRLKTNQASLSFLISFTEIDTLIVSTVKELIITSHYNV